MRLSQKLHLVNQHTKSAPVDVEGLALALGLEVQYAYLSNNISGMLEHISESEEYRITVNANHPPTRQRFTLAHEIGHFILHKHLVGNGVDDDRAYRSTDIGRYHNTSIGPREESEANKFAATILMPHRLIEKLKSEKGLTTPHQLAEALGVSEHAMCIRMGVEYRPEK